MIRLIIIIAFLFACASPILAAVFTFRAVAVESRPLSVKCLAAGAAGGIFAGIAMGVIVLNQKISLDAVPAVNWLGFICAGFSLFSLTTWAVSVKAQ